MSSLIERKHEAVLNSIAEGYRRDGYSVDIEPTPAAVPFDLGGYIPDMVARKGELAVLVEIKTQADSMSLDRLRSIVDEVKRHDGWRFVLVNSQDVSSLDLASENEDLFSWDEIARRIDDAKHLGEIGENEAAYLTLWIAFERMMRFQVRQIELPLDGLSPSILIRQLYSQGELSMTQFDAALRFQNIRNRIVHGFAATDVESEIASLSSLVRELLQQWQAPDDEC